MTVGERLATARIRKGWTQDDVSKRLGVARTTYAMYEQDRRDPDTETWSKIANLFEESLDWLMTGSRSFEGVTSPEQAEFLQWVEGNLEDVFFYDFKRSPEEQKEYAMETLRLWWQQERKREQRAKEREKKGD